MTCLLCTFPVLSMLSVHVFLKLEIKLSFVKATEIQSVFLILSLWQNRDNKLSVELLNNFFHSLSFHTIRTKIHYELFQLLDVLNFFYNLQNLANIDFEFVSQNLVLA